MFYVVYTKSFITDIKDSLLYYTGVINVKNKDKRTGTNLPCFEMVSSRQSQYYIQQWLEYVVLQFKKNHPSSWPVFRYAITDYSRALLNSVCFAFNGVNLLLYINITYDWLMNTAKLHFDEFTHIHLCYSHIKQIFFRILKKHYSSKTNALLRRNLLIYLDKIANEVNYSRIKTYWLILSKICRTKRLSESRIEMMQFDNIISQTNTSKELVNDVIEDDYCENVMFSENSNSNEKSLYKRMKYYMDLELLVNDHKNFMNKDAEDQIAESNINPYYNPDFVHEVERDFFSILPLWTLIFDNEFSEDEPIHFTNAPIESYFSEIKVSKRNYKSCMCQ